MLRRTVPVQLWPKLVQTLPKREVSAERWTKRLHQLRGGAVCRRSGVGLLRQSLQLVQFRLVLVELEPDVLPQMQCGADPAEPRTHQLHLVPGGAVRSHGFRGTLLLRLQQL